MKKRKIAPRTLAEAKRYFGAQRTCQEYLLRLRWPAKRVACLACNGTKLGQIKKRRLFQCQKCRKQFSTRLGTIFEDSPLKLSQWFVAVWGEVSSRKRISSYALADALGITQKSAWRMVHRIKLAMQTRSYRRRVRKSVSKRRLSYAAVKRGFELKKRGKS